eukprot:8753306-Alexandrium_andersonii.AAC.1
MGRPVRERGWGTIPAGAPDYRPLDPGPRRPRSLPRWACAGAAGSAREFLLPPHRPGSGPGRASWSRP